MDKSVYIIHFYLSFYQMLSNNIYKVSQAIIFFYPCFYIIDDKLYGSVEDGNEYETVVLILIHT